MNLLTKMFVTIVTMFITLPTLAQSLESEGRSDLNLRSGVTDISSQVYDLHMLMFMVCVGIAVVVFGVMFISMFLHRKSRGAKPANFHESVKVEIAWTVVPFIILILMAFPAAKTLIAMEDTSEADMTVLVTGREPSDHHAPQRRAQVACRDSVL